MSDQPEDERWREYQVTPRYLAGSGGFGDPAFAPVDHWPRHDPADDTICQLLITSPDGRLTLGWFGDDYDPVKVTAAEDAVGPVRWTARFNQNFPPEITASFTSALARDWEPDGEHFLAQPSIDWADSVTPLLDAGWERQRASEPGTVELRAPDQQAGAWIDTRSYGREDESVVLWAGPKGYLTRAEATFSSDTPSHLIAATAAALNDPTPLVRERHMIHRDVEHLIRLEPVNARPQPRTGTPTPLDAKHAAVAAALQRAAHSQPGARRAEAARIRTTQIPPRPSATPASSARADTAATRAAARPRR
ncbi:DUF317 domain-containing protein [Streptomyces sulphureus]|uniref:DUF317 domain-containing protein n=1 Tax=Streptomyces sulphureus TaxID=47758 RepID=UPI0003671ABF|nr:DUF317 domain-containing protein [Streptomyces sulphureus]